MKNLKKEADYYQNRRETVFDVLKQVKRDGLKATWQDRSMWNQMRMLKTDMSDVTGYTFLTNGKNIRGAKRCKMESKYMTLEKYAATLKVGDEVTIEYHSMAGDRQTIEKILKITKGGTIYLRSTNCRDAIRFRKNGQWLDNFGYQGGLISGYSLKNPYKNPFDFTRVEI